MAEKCIAYIGFKLSDTDKRALEVRAKQLGVSVSELVRQRATAGEPPATPSTAPATHDVKRPPELRSHHVDDLGPDPLRGLDQSMLR